MILPHFKTDQGEDKMSRYKTLPHYAMRDDFKFVHFKPWIGRNYENGGDFGRRILLLGESFYTKVHINAPREETTDHIRHIIQKFAVNENSGFYAKVRNLVLRGAGRSTDGFGSVKHRQCFWDSVVFYNFIQEFVGTKPKVRPKLHMWEDAQVGYLEVLEELKPDVCIILGKELWAHVPKSHVASGYIVTPFRDEATGTRFRKIEIGGHQILSTYTPHPSSVGGYKKKEVVPIARRLFELSISSLKL